ncbi:type II toxin-antitoxin system RelE/ParE family toxin [Limibacterium fermenti]|uniref:type II toxin-antitoxin system RelE/ParE family toxin n=1 Tax=Limibacterium fermenti TaxID=3229863 RepID=UPI0026C9CD7D
MQKKELKNIFDYYKANASITVAENLVKRIVETTLTLGDYAEIGQREELLLDRKENFRCLVYKKYKIIYWFNKNKNRIEISDIFDTRQNPIKIRRYKT